MIGTTAMQQHQCIYLCTVISHLAGYERINQYKSDSVTTLHTTQSACKTIDYILDITTPNKVDNDYVIAMYRPKVMRCSTQVYKLL